MQTHLKPLVVVVLLVIVLLLVILILVAVGRVELVVAILHCMHNPLVISY